MILFYHSIDIVKKILVIVIGQNQKEYCNMALAKLFLLKKIAFKRKQNN